MKIAQEIRAGNVIMHGKDPMVVLKTEYSRGGRNSATVRMKLKSLLSNSGTEVVFKADDKMDQVILDKKECTYSYFADPMYAFMDAEYNQFEVESENMGDAIQYLEDGMPVEVVFYDGKAISVELPTSVVREITWTEPAVKGDTSGKVLKPPRSPPASRSACRCSCRPATRSKSTPAPRVPQARYKDVRGPFSCALRHHLPMPFDFTRRHAPFRMQPGLRRIAPGSAQLTPSAAEWPRTCARRWRCCATIADRGAARRSLASTLFRRSAHPARESASTPPIAFALDGARALRAPVRLVGGGDGDPKDRGRPRTHRRVPRISCPQRSAPPPCSAWRSKKTSPCIDGGHRHDSLAGRVPAVALGARAQARPALRRGPRAGRRQRRCCALPASAPGRTGVRHTALGALRLDDHPARSAVPAPVARCPDPAGTTPTRCAAHAGAGALAHRAPDLHCPPERARRCSRSMSTPARSAQALTSAEQALQLRDALASMSPAVLAYRGLTAPRAVLLDWLAHWPAPPP
jgi:elongation factor P